MLGLLEGGKESNYLVAVRADVEFTGGGSPPASTHDLLDRHPLKMEVGGAPGAEGEWLVKRARWEGERPRRERCS